MGCNQGKQCDRQSNTLTVRKCLQEIEQTIQSVESLNITYQEDNKLATNIKPSIDKIQEFVKFAFQNHKSESFVTQATIQQKLSYDEYAKQLISIQQSARLLIIKGSALYEQKQTTDKSPAMSAFIQKLMSLQEFALKLKIPVLNPEIQQQDMEAKLQFLVKQLSKSQDYFESTSLKN